MLAACALKRNPIEGRVAHNHPIGEQSQQRVCDARKDGSIPDSGGVDSVEAYIQRIERRFRVHQRVPNIRFSPTNKFHRRNLAYARNFCVCGLYINGYEAVIRGLDKTAVRTLLLSPI